MDVEKEGEIVFFLEFLVTWKGDRLLHTVYRKPMHTDIYLRNNSNHLPNNTMGLFVADRNNLFF